MNHDHTTDRLRQSLTVVAAVGQVVLPALLAPRFERDEQPPDVLTPTPATFAIWFPIFATSLAHARVQARPGRGADPVLRAVGGPAALAYAATAAWAPMVRTRRYWPAQGALFAIGGAAEVARRRLAAAEVRGELPADLRRTVVPAIGMLAGWGAAASAVNLGSMVVGEGPVPEGGPARTVGTLLTLATAAAGTVAATTAEGGSTTAIGRIYLGTVAWALCGIVVGQRRSAPTVAAAAGAGLLLVAAAAAAGARPRSA